MTIAHARRFCLFLAPICLAGCLTTPTVEPLRYYTLTPELPSVSGVPADATLGIRPIVGARPYRVEMAYTASENQIAYFRRGEWAESPAVMLNRTLTDAIEATGIFRDVGDAANMARPDYILTGELRRFEADYTADTPQATVEASFAIRKAAGQEALWNGVLRASAPLSHTVAAGKSANDDVLADVTRAMSAAVSRLVTEMCEELSDATAAAA